MTSPYVTLKPMASSTSRGKATSTYTATLLPKSSTQRKHLVFCFRLVPCRSLSLLLFLNYSKHREARRSAKPCSKVICSPPYTQPAARAIFRADHASVATKTAKTVSIFRFQRSKNGSRWRRRRSNLAPSMCEANALALSYTTAT